MSLYRSLGRRLYEGEFNYAFSVSLKHKYMYVENAKAACTSIKSILGEWEFSNVDLGPHIPRAFFENVHVNVVGTPFVKPFQLGEDLFNTIARSDEYFRFSFVRNPYTRLLSGYLDKVVGQTPEAEQIVLEARSLGITNAPENLTFANFLRAIESIMAEGRPLDKHWRAQSFQLWPEEISYDFIGKIESLTDDVAYVAARLGLEAPPSTERVHGHETRAATHVTEYYNDETVALVRKLYESDFDLFGYGRELPK